MNFLKKKFFKSKKFEILKYIFALQLHSSIVTTNLNITKLREIETMNGHLFKMNRSVTLYRRMVCEMCKRITDSAHCEG